MTDFNQDDFADDQLAVSSFAPHHSTRIFFPDLTLLRRDEEEEGYSLLDFHDDSDTEDRYEPLPLIRDNAVEAHAGRENDEETSYFTRSRAIADWPRVGEAFRPSREGSAFDRLVTDMQAVEKYMGTTKLSMLTRWMRGDGAKKRRNWARVKRVTQFMLVGGETHDSTTIYEFHTSRLHDENGPKAIEAPWYVHLGQIPLRRNDRAYRHVRNQLRRQGCVSHQDIKWAPRSEENVSRLLDSKITPVDPESLDEEDKLCVVCTCVLGSEDAPEPVALPCEGNHCVLCKECIIRWINNTGPDKANCPKCRRRIFKRQAEINDLRFGLINGIYETDDRFSPWENFERSCSDLDRELAENKDGLFVLNANLFVQVWDIVLDGTGLEIGEDQETPDELQPLVFEEWEIADSVLREQIVRCNGRAVTTKELVAGLIEAVYAAFARKFMQSRMGGHLTIQEYMDLWNDPAKVARLDVPPGFKECFKRCLNRTLRFLEVRQCCCTPRLFHNHGLRQFYNAADTALWAPLPPKPVIVDRDGDVDMEGC